MEKQRIHPRYTDKELRHWEIQWLEMCRKAIWKPFTLKSSCQWKNQPFMLVFARKQAWSKASSKRTCTLHAQYCNFQIFTPKFFTWRLLLCCYWEETQGDSPHFSGWHQPTSRAEQKHSSTAHSHTVMNTQTDLKWAPWAAATLIYTTWTEKYPLTDKRKLTVSQTPPVLSCTSFHIQYYFKCRNLTTGLFTFIWKIKLQLCICVLYFEARFVRGVFVVVLFCNSTQGLSSILLMNCYRYNSIDWAGDLLTAERAAMMENSDFISLSL